MTILLVEDNKDLADYITQGLTGEVRIVGSLERAKAYLAMEPIHLVLLDLGLPDSQGLDTLKAIKEHRIPVVVLTANTELAEEAAKLDVLDYVIKRDARDLLTRIRFNISKLYKTTRSRSAPRFAPEAFEKLKEYLVCPFEREHELTHAH